MPVSPAAAVAPRERRVGDGTPGSDKNGVVAGRHRLEATAEGDADPGETRLGDQQVRPPPENEHPDSALGDGVDDRTEIACRR